MYKALLVDDEPGILRGLQDLIQWEEFGIEIAGHASHGGEALELIRQSNINILITDIKMPVMDGLELIRQAKRANRQLKYIILSGYDDFALVKEAALLGIENYLLKPIVREELSLTLQNIGEKIESELHDQIQLRSDTLILRTNILNRWLSGAISPSELEQRADLLKLDLDRVGYQTALIKILYLESDQQSHKHLLNYAAENICNEILSASPEKTITVNEPSGYVAVIFFGSNSHADMIENRALLESCTECIRKFLKRDCFVTMGGIEKESENLHRSYKQALRLMEYSYILPPNTVMDDDRTKGDITLESLQLPTVYETLKSHILSKDKEAVAGFIDSYFRKLSLSRQLNPAIVQQLSIEFLFHILSFLQSLKIDTSTLFEREDTLLEQLKKPRNLTELVGWLSTLAIKVIDQIEKENEDVNPIIKRVLSYIETNYAENMSLKTLSASFNVNTAYLGQMFIKEMGEPFSNYLNEKRINKAKELLRTTDLELNEIAELVGYVNQSYFSNLFKKATGIYPTKYRHNTRGIGN